MQPEQFQVTLKDLEAGPRRMVCAIVEDWLKAALQESDAEPRGPGQLDVNLERTGRRVVVRGRAAAPLTMPCARSLVPTPVDVDAEIFLVLEPAEPRAKPASSNRGRAGRRALRGQAVAPSSRNIGDPQAKTGGRSEALADLDAAHDVYSGEVIVLDAFVREALLLELPMMPLASGLPSGDSPGIHPTRDAAESGGEKFIDERLKPLAEIMRRLGNSTKE